MTPTTEEPGGEQGRDSELSPDEECIEQLVFECLEAEDPDDAIAVLTRDRPELADRVRAAVDAIRLGTFEGGGSAADGVTPLRLGPFRLLRQLGAGGMGIVYLAEQEDLGRMVALKIIRPEHLYFPGSRERFRREVEAVARLQHAGIVSVFTVGEAEGTPYFTMEYVQGESLAGLLRTFADRDPATLQGSDLAAALRSRGETAHSETASRRDLFEQTWVRVCLDLTCQIADALQHAHERGVLHRDVKPSNILITDDGRARLVDFGLARTEGTPQMTASTAQIGSLPYLPPERIDAQTDVPNVRQDVYSVGVTLYEMLALDNPFLGDTAEQTRRNILAGRPARLRPRNAAVNWDLETVCLKAMDPDPAQRYPSLAALTEDLDQVRHRRPIHAQRPSPSIRLRRWGQRHPTAVAVGGVASILVAVAAVLFAWFESSARRESDRLTGIAEQKAREADEVTTFLVDLFRYASPDTSLGEDLPVRLLLQQGADHIDRELAGQPEISARLLGTLGQVYSWLGEPSKALAFYRRAGEQLRKVKPPEDPAVLAFHLRIADQEIVLGAYEEADRTLADLTRLRPAGLGPRHPLVLEARQAQARLRNLRGDSAGAERLELKILAEYRRPPVQKRRLAISLRTFAAFLKDENRHVEAQPLFDECLSLMAEVYPPGHPAHIGAMRNAAENLASLGQFDAALEMTRKGIAEVERIFGMDHPMAATMLTSAAEVYRETGDIEASMAAMRRVYDIVRVYRDVSKNYYARTLNDLAVNYHDIGQYAQARDLLEQALVVSREAFPGDHILTAFVLQNLGNALEGLGSFAAAETQARAGMEMMLRLDPERPEVARARNGLAWVLIQIGTAAGQKEAKTLLEDAVRIASARPSETWTLGRALSLLGLMANQSGDAPAAEALVRRALTAYQTVRQADHPAKAITLYNLAWSRLTQNDLPEAERRFQESIAMYNRMGQDYPEKAYPLGHYGFALLRRRPADAVPLLEEALEIRRRVFPKHARWRVISTLNLGLAYERLKRFEEAESLLLEVHAAVLATTGKESPAAIASARRLVHLYRGWGRKEKADPYRRLAGKSLK